MLNNVFNTTIIIGFCSLFLQYAVDKNIMSQNANRTFIK